MFKPESFTDMRTAQEIMGKNFFGPNEAKEHLGSVVSKEYYAMLMFTPFSKAELQEYASTHHLVAILPMSILDMWTLHPEIFRTEDWQSGLPPTFHRWNQTKYNDLYLSPGHIGWRLMRTKPLVLNTQPTHEGKVEIFVYEKERPATPREIVYAMVAHYLATGEHLFEKVYLGLYTIATEVENKIGIHIMGGVMPTNGLGLCTIPRND